MKNVIFFFCDELRADALGCYGNQAGPMKTPNMDWIAENGVLFEECFCPSPVCVASRNALLTGRYPEETAVYDNEAAYPNFRMAESAVTFPELLAQAGYRTANFGKIHVAPELRPFQVHNYEGAEMHLGLSQEERKGLKKLIPKGGISFNAASLYPEGKDYFPEKVAENALAWMGEETGPYFLRLSWNQPHSPIIVKRGYELLYRDHAFSGKLPDVSGLSAFEQSFAKAVALDAMTEEEIIQAKVYYYGMVSWVDDEIGKVLDFLRQRGELENTVLLLSSDHGALRGEVRGLGKHVFQRKSQQIPLLIAAPGLPKGQRRSDICSLMDLPRTLFGLLDLELPGSFHGRDLFRDPAEKYVFSTKGFGEKESCAFPNRQMGRLPGDRGWPRRACVRSRRYRLDMNTRIDGRYAQGEERDIFFTDCLRYPEEDVNLVSDPLYSEIVREMTRALEAHVAGQREVDPAALRRPAGMKGGSQD